MSRTALFTTTLAALVALGVAAAEQSAIPFFNRMRDVNVTQRDRQNYILVDEEIWQHARPDLGDLRLYSDSAEVPYALRVQRFATEAAETEVKVLQLGSVRGTTEFVLDTAAVPEYDRVKLQLEAHDFIVRAQVEGADSLPSTHWANLGTYTLYDFTREKLGSNSTPKLPLSRWQYLRIALPGIRPEQVKGATIANVQEKKAAWTAIGASPQILQQGRETVITWNQPERVPLERVEFQLAATGNFRRPVAVQDAESRTVAHGEISRVHLARGGRTVDSEGLAIAIPGVHTGAVRLVIQNGDDRPLPITAVRPLSNQRRVYFNPQGRTPLHLYYGDEKLTAPVYDYAKFFAEDAEASLASLGPGTRNVAFTGRPDDRPWSDRHPFVLWAALIIAVLGLGVVALRGMRAAG